MLAGLYIGYVLLRSILNPNLAPKPRPEDIPDVTGHQVLFAMMTSFFPLAFLILSVLGSILFGLATPSEAAAMGALGGIVLAVAYRLAGIAEGKVKSPWEGQAWGTFDGWLFSLGFGGIVTLILTVIYVITVPILANILGIDIVREPGFLIRPGVGIVLALVIAVIAQVTQGRTPLLRWLWPERDALKRTYVFAGRGALIGLAGGIIYLLMFSVLGLNATFRDHQLNRFGVDVGFFLGMAAYFCWKVNDQDRLRESIYLTVRTSAMVCWLFVGSWTFSSVFSYLGGEQLIKEFVLSMDLSPLTFLLLAQLIIFLLGWPLEWSEIIIIFVPIFLPLLPHFNVDPLFFGILVALNLQTSFLTPPMAMAAYYLKGVAPPHVTLIHIFKGVLPFLSMIFLSMIILYIFPGIAMWLPTAVYGH
jgi:TRAP-type mannitol/chloroaromatic compound transport system permease large subunit